MWLMIERIRGGELTRNYFRSKEDADNFLTHSIDKGKIVSHKLVERHCGKLVTDPPEPMFSVPELEPEEDYWNEDITDLEIAEEYYLDPEVDVDDWEDYMDT